MEHAIGTADPLFPIDLYEAGDPAFVHAVRAYHDADVLADFAGRWFEDVRPASRRLLGEYLDRPLNAYRHEGLIKRLFKRAEAAGDDAVMARFLVLFDRSIRRVRRKLKVRDLISEPRFDPTVRHAWQTTMPRGEMVPDPYRGVSMPDWALALNGWSWWRPGQNDARDYPDQIERLKKFRLFSLATRSYLRRRAWRYFRKLGRAHPDRYVAAACQALTLYRDEDVADALALIDNWGLIHLLFHHAPALRAKADGWIINPGHSLGELSPSPIFGALWSEAFEAVAGLIKEGRCRPVRLWAVRMLRTDLAKAARAWPLVEWIKLLEHDEAEVVALAADVLGQADGLGAIEPERWLNLLDSANPTTLEVLCDLVSRHVRADQVSLEQAVRFARSRPTPLARLGLGWLMARDFPRGQHDRLLLDLIEAEAEAVRPQILRWLRQVLQASSAIILEFLDSRHADARSVGWSWFVTEPSTLNDVNVWKCLLETPYDDVRLPLVAELEARSRSDDPATTLDPDALRRLWASVLLNVHRGSRAKPVVVRQLLQRLEAMPGDAPKLLPLLSVALRSIRGPERRSALVALVRLVEHQPETEPLVVASFPELQMT